MLVFFFYSLYSSLYTDDSIIDTLQREAWKDEKSKGVDRQEATLKCSSANTHYFYTCTVKEEEKTLHYMRGTLQISGV